MSQIHSATIRRAPVTFVAKVEKKSRKSRYLACNKKKGTFAIFGDKDFADDWRDENGGVVIPFQRLGGAKSGLPTWVVVRCIENTAAADGTLLDAAKAFGVATTIKTLRRVISASYAAYNVSASKVNEVLDDEDSDAPRLPLLGQPELPIGNEMSLDDCAAVFAGNDDDDEATDEEIDEATAAS